MGGSASTHRVTVVNEHPAADVVKISDDVVRRLKGEDEKQQSRPAQPAIGAPPPVGQPISYPMQYPGGMNSLEVRQKVEDEVGRVEASWKQRVAELEKQNQALWKASNEKFADTLSTMETKYLKRTCKPVCKEQEASVLKCYQENSKMPLNCSKEVQAFAKCVDLTRREAITQRG